MEAGLPCKLTKSITNLISYEKDYPSQKRPHFDISTYSEAVLVDGLLFVWGQTAVDFETSQFMLGTIEKETRRKLDKIKPMWRPACMILRNAMFICPIYAN
jgi:2-iminobutanoate/2-iminopropanoate deaminase